ncbi:tRNA (guanine-N1)-methyltransferase [Sulfolobus tengchongensis]|uniref:tRNA (Guanine-N1)-methyltransferase n=1 Tax=Sulfolobus tengchongensis TaxID=207809 RepID=A0AAX4L186_9CREN
MILGKIFAKYLKDNFGVESLKLTTLRKFFRTGYLQSIAINSIIYDYGIVEREDYGRVVANENEIKVLKGNGTEKTNYVVLKNGKIRVPNEIIPSEPQFIIDLGLSNVLTDEEKTSLREQLQLTVKAIREYLCDYNLKFAHVYYSLKLEGKNKVETIDHIPKERAIVLNPYGDVVANEEIIRGSRFFIIGGIVDKGRRLTNATSELARRYDYLDLPQVKITLRDSVVGVPDRINKIVEILLKVINGLRLEEAIISSQSNADKVNRLVRELNRLEKIDQESISNLKNWLKVNDKLFNLALKKSKFKDQSNSS